MTVKLTRLLLFCSIAAVLCTYRTGKAEPGLTATFDFGQRLETEREEVGSSTRDTNNTRTDLGFGLTSVTRAQELSVNVRSELEYNLNNNNNSDLNVNRLFSRADYRISNRQSALNFRFSYTEQEVDDAVIDDVEDETGDFIDFDTGDGLRETLDFGSELSLGRTGPISFDLRYAYRDVDFSDTDDSDLTGDTRNSINAILGFELSPVLSLDTSYSWRDLESKSATGTDRTTEIYRLQGTYLLSRRTTLTASINETAIDSTSPSDDDGGLGYAFGMRQLQENGSLSANFSSTETVNGERRQVSFGRAIEIPRGSVNLSLGAAKTGSLTAEPLVGLGLNYQASARTSFNVNLTQRVRTNNDDEETIVSRLNVGYFHSINSRSSLSGSLQLANENVLTAEGDDQRTFRGNLTYRHDVGDDWDVVTGVEFRQTDRSVSNDRTIQRLFVGLTKSFNFRP